jgi:hypothetical protein
MLESDALPVFQGHSDTSCAEATLLRGSPDPLLSADLLCLKMVLDHDLQAGPKPNHPRIHSLLCSGRCDNEEPIDDLESR